jgi:hypothetical protein
VGLLYTSILGTGSSDRVFHIQEAAGAIERLAEYSPTDYYYDKLLISLQKRHPKADRHLLDHLVALEAFLFSTCERTFSIV